MAAQLPVTPQERLISLAESSTSTVLVEEVRLHPEEARAAFRELLKRTPTDPSPAAERLALAYAEAWTDPFLVNRFRRFSSWSKHERLAMLAGDSLRDLGNVSYAREGVDRALVLWRESLAYHQELGDNVGVARSMGNIGAGFYAAGLPDSADAYYRRSRELALEVGDFAAAANALTMLATLSKESGDLAEAGVLYLRALETHERIGALRSVAADRHNLGLVALEMGDLEGARRELTAALEVSQRTGRREDQADHLSSLADVALVLGEYPEAHRLLQRALVLALETDNEAGRAGIQHSLGVLAMARGDYRLAISELGAARDLYSQLGYAANEIAARSDLARALAAAGDLHGGLAEMRAVVSAAESSGASRGVIAELELSRGELNLLLNEYARAEENLRRAEDLFRSLSDFSGIAAAQRGRALVHLYQDEPRLALTILGRALRVQQLSEAPAPAARTRLLIAAAQALAGDSVAARSVLADALDVFRALEDPVGEATALQMLATLELAAGSGALADSLYTRGLTRLEGLDVPELRWRLHAGRATLFDRAGAPDSAVSSFRQAVGEVERVVGVWPGSEALAGYLADKWTAYEGLALAELRVGNEAEAFRISERLRAQRTLHLLHRGRIRTSSLLGDLADREQDLRQKLANLSALSSRGEVGPATLRGGALRPAAFGGDISQALGETRRQYEELLEEIREAEFSHGALVAPGTADWEAVSRSLASEEIFLEYLLTDSAGTVFVITERELGVVELDVGREAVGDLVGFLRGVLGRRPEPGDAELWRTALRRLDQFLLEPVRREGWLEGRTHLHIAAHGTLHYLPFAALIGPDGSFLVKARTVTYAPSASVWLGLVEGPRPHPPNDRILALAPRTEGLPGTLREVGGIGEVWPGEVVVRTGVRATEEWFREEGSGSAIIHVATYGVVNRANPLFSHLDLNPSGPQDGRLEVHEIFGLTIGADLVVLSACETAVASGSRADVPPGDDWIGFTRGFLAAGARNVLGSLWRVEDESTAELMTEFYRALGRGSPASGALAEAQRSLMARTEYANPFFWSGFSLVGEGRSRW